MSGTTITLGERQQTLKHRSLWRDAWHSALRNPFAVGGALIVLFFVAAALVGPLLTPYDYREQDLLNTEQGLSWEHWFGTDELGRDFLSRILYGARTAFLVATMVTVVGGSIGVFLGATAALSERFAGGAIMRLIDVLMSFPHLVLVPGGVLAVVIFAFNFFGDALNDALNPRSRRR